MHKVKIEHYKILTLLHIQIRKKYRDKKRSLEILISLKTPKVAATYSHTINALPSA